MNRARLFASTLLLVAAATALGAQGPGRGRGQPPFASGGQPPFAGGGGGNALGATAEFLLSHTGDLRLSDNQVVRLASIARRSADRRRAWRDSLEDLRPTSRSRTRGDSLDRDERRQEFDRNAERMRSRMERVREQVDDDRRDAIAVLTADQQAQAWEMVASRTAPGFMGGMRGFGPGGARSGGPGGARGRMRVRPDDDGVRQAPPDGQRSRRPPADTRQGS